MNNPSQFNDYIKWVSKYPDKTNHQIKLAIKRHKEDLKKSKSKSFNYKFDIEKVARPLLFINKFIKHSEGEFAGKQFILSDWQVFLLGLIFGWIKKDTGTRRFNNVFLYVGRKNGKTTLLSCLALYFLLKDNEVTPRIYSAATKRDQARLLHESSKRMIMQSPELKKRIKIRRYDIEYPGNFGLYEPLSSDAQTLDGLNSHFAALDELAYHRDDSVYNVLSTSMGARTQPLLFSITTAGYDRNSFCHELLSMSNKVLTGDIKDDRFLPLIYQIEPEDDWKDPSVFIKANPNLGVSISEEFMNTSLERAKHLAQFRNAFLVKHLNRYVDTLQAWVNQEAWLDCYSEYTYEDVLECQDIFIGLDLSNKLDMTSITVLGRTGENYLTWSFNFLPVDGITRLKNTTTLPVDNWIAEKHLLVHDGSSINYNSIYEVLKSILEVRPDTVVGYDPWDAHTIIDRLDEGGYSLVTVRQGYITMSPAMKLLEKLYISKQIQHPNNLVLNSAMSAMVTITDPAGNIKPVKGKSTEKIDSAVSLIIALATTMGEVKETDAQRLAKENEAVEKMANDPIFI